MATTKASELFEEYISRLALKQDGEPKDLAKYELYLGLLVLAKQVESVERSQKKVLAELQRLGSRIP